MDFAISSMALSSSTTCPNFKPYPGSGGKTPNSAAEGGWNPAGPGATIRSSVSCVVPTRFLQYANNEN